MAELPRGTVTLVFTDIDGSTRLLQALGDLYGEALSAHRLLMRSAITDGGGHELGTEGDSFFVAFDSARSAIRTCLSAQRSLRDHSWPQGLPVAVRMGVHTGEPVRHEDGYIGLDVHRAARIASAAHGGQILVSDTTRRLLADSLAPEVDFVVMGRHRLKDLPNPELLHQLCGDGLPSEFPPLRSLGSISALPRFSAPLVGRRGELRRVLRHVGEGGSSPVTLTGPGGSGKTRLGVRVAEELAQDHGRSVYFVALEAVTELDAAWRAVAAVVGVPGEHDVRGRAAAVLASGPGALVLDNVEQIPGAAELVQDLMNDCPDLVIVVTSRRPLRLRSEKVVEIGPLAVVDATKLFGRQAALARNGFRVDDSNREHVEKVCERLDRIPLAIELAAARTRLLPPRSLLARLDLSLAGAAVDVPERHRSLRATVAWSYNLLGADEQRALERIGAFEGGCDLEALADVLERPAPEVFERVETLADASLLQIYDGWGGEPRVGLLTTVRQYAAERLALSGDEIHVRFRHAEHYAALVEAAAERLRGPAQLEWLTRLRAEHANAAGALQWCLEAADSDPRRDGRLELGLRIANGLMWFWYRTGASRDGAELLKRLQDMQIGPDDVELIQALQGLAVLLLQVGESAQSVPILERSLATWRSRGEERRAAQALNSLGVAMRDNRHPEKARDYLLESIETSRRLGDLGRLAAALSNLSQVALDQQRTEEAVVLMQESLALDRQSGDRWAVCIGETNLAGAMIDADRLEEAQQLLSSVASSVLDLGDLDSVADVLERGVALRRAQGRVTEAAQLYGAARRLRLEAQVPLGAVDGARVDSVIAAARTTLAESDWDEAVVVGEQQGHRAALRLLAD